MAYSTINKSTDYFNTKLYTGNASTQSITGVGFQPDWCWFKGRNFADSHVSIDAVRGTNKAVYQDTTGAETTQTHYFTSFDSDGYTLGNSGIMNGSSRTYASWNWKANGAGSSNTDGSITSTVSANTTAGFSIVSYTGTGSAATIGHGLGVAPACIIFKDRDAVVDWFVYHQSTGATNRTKLNQTVASSASTFLNDTAPSSTVFNTEGGGATGTNGNKFIAYCFAEVPGYSKFGSYTGNGNADGTFVYTGFKPSMVILKDYTSALNYNWIILDNKRDPSNGLDRRLQPSSSSAEYTDISDFCDFTSNGFKWRGSQANWNASGTKYIYMAFGQSLVGSNNVPCTAR